uniref:Major facilitator superfamily (MFS) profile domain-containing protein n=1 Tax=Photinus pyralis TaxID=7054 RepID=A0A1Y1KD84_PHOPY
MSSSHPSLDSILCDLGQLGKYQCFTVTLFSIAVIIHSAIHTAFVFTARNVQYRCEVPGCESSPSETWLQNAIPFVHDQPSKCTRFLYLNGSECNYLDFNRSIVERCNDYVYVNGEATILHDFDLQCDENLWKLTLVGTVNSIGQFVGLPIAGFFSDRYGRLTTLIVAIVSSGIFGIIRSFSPSYIFFCVFEFLDSAFGAGAYTCGYILGVELVGPQRRVLMGTLISCSYALGEVLLGGLAWGIPQWRPFLQVLCSSSFILLFYYWIAPESVRWLLVQQKFNKAKQILSKVAKVNGKSISNEYLTELCTADQSSNTETYPITSLFKSWRLCLRFLNCCFCWISCVFVFYGLTINSVALSSNPYLDFILTSLAEIPGYLAVYLLVDKLGRRICESSMLIMTSLACIAFNFVPLDLHWLRLLMFLIGKCAGTAAFAVCYIITSEIFPTPLRHSLMATCSMFGRVGSMIAPQMPLLEKQWKPLPIILFATMAFLSGVFSLFFPETANTHLPDTIKEAEEIGKNKPENKYTFPS